MSVYKDEKTGKWYALAWTPEKLAEWAEMLQMLTEEGAVRTAGSAAAIHAEADRYDMILNPFDPSDRE